MCGGGGGSYGLPILPRAEWINKESLRFCFEGSDELAVDMGLVNQPYKIFDSEGAVLAQGNIPKDGRLPRVMTDQNKTARIEIGKNKWQKYTADATSSELDEDVLSKETAPAANDPYIGLMKQGSTEARLSKELLIAFVGDVQGEA